MKISRLGEAPDYRFSLANERTFLAWIRTALGFLAAGVGLDQLAPDFATPVIRQLLALLLCLFSGGLAIYGYLRWLRNEKAMRLKDDLPYTHSLLVISLRRVDGAGGQAQLATGWPAVLGSAGRAGTGSADPLALHPQPRADGRFAVRLFSIPTCTY